MADQVTIANRFRGPAESANGGYACGALARFVAPRSAEVTLRLPPPLDRPLTVEVDGGGRATMLDGDAVVAEAQAIEGIELDVPDPPSLEQAAAARDASPMQHEHPYPQCFVCGSGREPSDGLKVTCGPAGGGLVASPWKVDESVANDDGTVDPGIVWSVLDCPGGISGMLLPDVGQSVLGRLAASIDDEIRVDMACVAIGWPIAHEGRKLQAGSALFSEQGDLLAHARATWIELQG
jgi:hypothetical protein